MQLSCLANLAPQPSKGQTCLRSPVWILEWRARWPDVVKHFSQILHLYLRTLFDSERSTCTGELAGLLVDVAPVGVELEAVPGLCPSIKVFTGAVWFAVVFNACDRDGSTVCGVYRGDSGLGVGVVVVIGVVICGIKKSGCSCICPCP